MPGHFPIWGQAFGQQSRSWSLGLVFEVLVTWRNAVWKLKAHGAMDIRGKTWHQILNSKETSVRALHLDKSSVYSEIIPNEELFYLMVSCILQISHHYRSAAFSAVWLPKKRRLKPRSSSRVSKSPRATLAPDIFQAPRKCHPLTWWLCC